MIRGDDQVRGNGQGGIEELERGSSRDHHQRRLRASVPHISPIRGFLG